MIRVSRCRCCLPLDPPTLWEVSRAAESIPLLERTLAGRERVLSPDDPPPSDPGTTSPPPDRHWADACPAPGPGGTWRMVRGQLTPARSCEPITVD
jgi:hypothetical protein